MPSVAPSPWSQLAQAAGQYETDQRQHKLQEAQISREKTDTSYLQSLAGEAKQREAMQRLQTLVQMGRGSSKTLPYDPTYQQSIDQAFRDAGLGEQAPRIEEPLVAGSPQTRSRIDVDAFTPKLSLEQLLSNSALASELDQLPGPMRKARLQAMGVDQNDPSVQAYVSAPRQMTPSERNSLANDVAGPNGLLSRGAAQQYTPEQYLQGIDALAIAHNLPPDQVQALKGDPSIFNQAAAAVRAKLSQLEMGNKKTQAQIETMIENAHSLDDLRKAQSRFYVEKTEMMPLEMQYKFRALQQRASQHAETINLGYQRLALEVQKIKATGANTTARELSNLRASITGARTAYDAANSQYISLQKFIENGVANGQPPSQEVYTMRDQAKAHVDALKATMDEAAKLEPTVLHGAMQGYLGTNQKLTGVDNNPVGSPIVGSKGTIRVNKLQGLVGVGKKYPTIQDAIKAAQSAGYQVTQ